MHLIAGVEHFYIVGPKTNEIAARMNGLKFYQIQEAREIQIISFEMMIEMLQFYVSHLVQLENLKGVLYSHKSIVTHAT